MQPERVQPAQALPNKGIAQCQTSHSPYSGSSASSTTRSPRFHLRPATAPGLRAPRDAPRAPPRANPEQAAMSRLWVARAPPRTSSPHLRARLCCRRDVGFGPSPRHPELPKVPGPKRNNNVQVAEETLTCFHFCFCGSFPNPLKTLLKRRGVASKAPREIGCGGASCTAPPVLPTCAG